MLAQCRFWVPPKGYASAGMRITCGIDNTVLYTKWLKLLSLKTTTNDYWLLVNGWYLFHIPHPIIKIHQCCVPQSVMLACAIGVYEKIPSSSQINISNCYTLTLFFFFCNFTWIRFIFFFEVKLHFSFIFFFLTFHNIVMKFIFFPLLSFFFNFILFLNFT